MGFPRRLFQLSFLCVFITHSVTIFSHALSFFHACNIIYSSNFNQCYRAYALKMDHFQENHMKALNELCRCCGNLNFTAKQKKIGSYPSLVCDRVGDILSIFDICVADDEEGKHSRYVCYTCVSKIRRAKSNSVGAVKSQD